MYEHCRYCMLFQWNYCQPRQHDGN